MRGEKFLNKEFDATSKMRTKKFFKKQEFLQKDYKKFNEKKKDRCNEFIN